MTNPENLLPDRPNNALFQYDRWRVGFLATIMRVVAGLGFLLIVANFPILGNAERVIFSAIYLAILVVAFAPLPYILKAVVLVAGIYSVGIYVVLEIGPWSGATAFFLASTLFAALLFDKRVDLWAFGLTIVTITMVGILNLFGRLPLAMEAAPPSGLLDWLSYLVDYLVLAGALIWAINLLKTEFKSVARQFHYALGSVSRDRDELERRVEERTAGLIKKTDQLRATSYIARQTAEIQDLDTILKVIAKLITDQFGFYHVGIFLMNETGDEVVLVSASSEGGRRMVEKGHARRVGSQGIVGYAADQKKPRIALDTGNDAVIFNNPDLPMTRSEVALPMLVRDRVLGVLDIHSNQPSAFSMQDIDILQTLADQIAIAIENTRLLEESQAALMQVEAMTASRTREAWGQKIREGNYAYTYTPFGIRSGMESVDPEHSLKVPITLRGQKIGIISLTHKDGTPWSEMDREMINEVAYQTGLAVDNVRLVEEATQRARQEQLVGELAARFSQTMDIDSLLQTAARELGRIPDVAEVSVYLGEIPGQAPDKRQL